MAAEGGRRRAAKVDATAEKELAQRFEVTGFPTLLLLSHRRAYTYDGAKRLARGTAVTEGGGWRGAGNRTAKPIPGHASVWCV